ncbi:MAG: DUF763 domain-containing protein [Bacteroidota bacterium]
MPHSGSADLSLMGGGIPPWLFDRMTKLSLVMVESILQEYGHQELLARMANPFWFQSFGAVIGMDWNSSGVTTAVLRALKAGVNPHAKELGLFICGGKGKESMRTPRELMRVGEITGLDGDQLVRHSRLSAKVDNTAIQDGFNIYIHSFLVSKDGDWSVVQQGMRPETKGARRYHWHSEGIQSFVVEPHSGIAGANQGELLDLTARAADSTRTGILNIAAEKPELILREIPKMKLPSYCGVKSSDIDLKRLGSVLWLAQEAQMSNFEELLLLKGLGPRTLQSLTLVSEVLHGTPSRFSDPARYAFAHGSKNGRVFPVPTKVYDETISTLQKAVERAKMGHTDKQKAISSLTKIAQRAEVDFVAEDKLDELIEHERKQSHKYGGRTVKGWAKPSSGQLDLFD